MNCVTQLLFLILITISHYFQFDSSTEGSISKFLFEIAHSVSSSTDVDTLKVRLVQYDKFYGGEKQEDVSECLMMLIKLIKKGSVPNCGSNDDNSTGVSLSEILSSFMLEKYIVCDACGLRGVSPMFPSPYVPQSLCSPLYDISPYVPHVPQFLCFPEMIPSPVAPQPYITQSLCSPVPMFPIPYVPRIMILVPMFPMFPRPYVTQKCFPVPLLPNLTLPSPCVPQYLWLLVPMFPVPVLPSPFVSQSI